MDLQRVLDGLDRCDAKLDARIMGGGVYPYRDKNKTEHYDDYAFYLREAGGLPCKTNKNKQVLVCFDEAHSAIDALEQLHIDWHAIFKSIWEAAVKYACESKICH
ncbi:MAG: hypothetical protein EZS28_048395 [Streblomastix strix]|uniref:Uncharacterized protein n=1 Tax=Streblomastix strix TaxID=222440 RepID=A0A5J4TCT2_9EUKA|nr:MAG: hypothetical protein EZS28_048395 [Streblomastix strix]